MTAVTGTVRTERPRLDLLAGVIDQALSSFTNFAPQVSAALLLAGTGFAHLSIAFLVTLIGIEVVRALTGEVLLSLPPAGQPEHGPLSQGDGGFAGRAVATVATLTVALSGMTIAGALVLAHGDLRRAVVAGAIIAPVVALQDVWRFVGFSTNDLRSVLVNDGLWCISLALAYAVYFAAVRPTTTGLLALWGLSCVPSLVLMTIRHGVTPSFRSPLLWFRESHWRGPRYCAEYLADRGSQSIGLLLAGGLSGAVVVSTVRGCQLLAGPVLVLVAGLSFVLAPQAARVNARESDMLNRWIVVRSLTLAATASLAVLALTVVPRSIGVHVLGDVWAQAAAMRAPLVVYIATGSIAVVLRLGVRAKGGERKSLRMRRVLFPVLLAAPVLGARAGAASGCMWGVAIATALVMASWIFVFATT